MSQPKTILTAAQDIRPHLSTLLDPETAQSVDLQLQGLLTQAKSAQAVENPITELLRKREPTREWMRRYFKGETPEQITRSIQGYSGLVGNPTLPPAKNYICPVCNTPWYREDNSPIPLCEQDLVPFVPAQP